MISSEIQKICQGPQNSINALVWKTFGALNNWSSNTMPCNSAGLLCRGPGGADSGCYARGLRNLLEAMIEYSIKYLCETGIHFIFCNEG